MKKKLYTLFIIVAFINNFNSQVGINTATPQKSLHVNGSLQITNELNTGGNATTSGSSGTAGQVLISQGAGQPPTWVNIENAENSNSPSTQRIAGIATRNLSTLFNANTISLILFNTNRIVPEYITYSNGSFTVNKAGFYSVNLYSELTVANDGGTVQLYIRRNNVPIFRSLNNFTGGVTSLGDSTGGIFFFNQGDIITNYATYTRSYRINNSSFSINYLGSNID